LYSEENISEKPAPTIADDRALPKNETGSMWTLIVFIVEIG